MSSSYSANEIKPGDKILVEVEPYLVLKNEFVKPGKGQAFNKMKLKHIKTGRVLDKTFRSGETLEGADVVDEELQYLYNDGQEWHFMSRVTFEQYSVQKGIVEEEIVWLKESDLCTATFYNGDLISITPQQFVILKVDYTEPSIKGDTVSGGSKVAVLETGASVRVPMFVECGDLIRINTRTGEYNSREKR